MASCLWRPPPFLIGLGAYYQTVRVVAATLRPVEGFPFLRGRVVGQGFCPCLFSRRLLRWLRPSLPTSTSAIQPLNGNRQRWGREVPTFHTSCLCILPLGTHYTPGSSWCLYPCSTRPVALTTVGWGTNSPSAVPRHPHPRLTGCRHSRRLHAFVLPYHRKALRIAPRLGSVDLPHGYIPGGLQTSGVLSPDACHRVLTGMG